MEMTKAEIIGKYRRMQINGNREEAIETLAQLNGCERYKIAKILTDNGLELPEELGYYKEHMEKDMERRAEEAVKPKKNKAVAPDKNVGSIKVETVAATRCQPGKSVAVWDQETHENARKHTETHKNTPKDAEKNKITGEITDEQAKTSINAKEYKPKMPPSVIAALMDRIDLLEEEMKNISQEQKELANRMEKKETEFLEICGFMGMGPQTAGE